MKMLTGFLLLLSIHLQSCAQEMDMESYNPKSTLVVPEHIIRKAKYPFIDVHNHQWSMPDQDLKSLLSEGSLIWS
jgi:hypothetical protein